MRVTSVIWQMTLLCFHIDKIISASLDWIGYYRDANSTMLLEYLGLNRVAYKDVVCFPNQKVRCAILTAPASEYQHSIFGRSIRDQA
jgi:hypothetical protein